VEEVEEVEEGCQVILLLVQLYWNVEDFGQERFMRTFRAKQILGTFVTKICAKKRDKGERISERF